MADVTRVCRGLAHIDPDRLLIGWTHSRRRRFGIYATIYPLRFARGATNVSARSTVWHLPRVLRDGREIDYVITFYIPRFLSLEPTARLSVVFHELFHVSEACDGDLRRFPGYRSAHGRSVRDFEAGFQADLAVYLASRRARFFHDLLTLSHREILGRYGAIVPRRVRRPVLERRRVTWEYETGGPAASALLRGGRVAGARSRN